ncbi:N-acyl homoserine lactonase family protein [Acidocella aromatica]|uniref:N-acyl homoserine lactone hydrolase n=1 Tax=Acidocella aromatica TaxID=1303579 RepID=A0A840VC90_9PROT|nr:N-acyl homoserine lactonase family protein [Acidocella aromatica]MBB5373326.1 N-acyl homoserine lactone hydrolase [Acidocella aromatica]
MTQVRKFWPLLTGLHSYEKAVSIRNRGHGEMIEAPILAYLIETANGRILYDVGCDYRKLEDPALRQRFYEGFELAPPIMREEDRLPSRLERLGLTPKDVDVVFLGHLHFDHAGGLHEFCHAELHVHEKELQAAREPADSAYFADDLAPVKSWRCTCCEYDLTPGVRAIETPGHTAGHMSMLIELPKGAPILLCGDAADLTENLEDEIAPGLCYRDDEADALASIRRLKQLAKETGAELWPNHDLSFFRAWDSFPLWRE